MKEKKRARPLRINFVNPPHADWCMVNLTTWLSMKHHYNKVGLYAEDVEWLVPPYKYNTYSSIEQIADAVSESDVVLFSSYIWNYDICDQVAQLIRLRSPEVCLILGGPHIGFGETTTGQDRPYYDYVCQPTKPGEVFMESFLNKKIGDSENPAPEKIDWEWRNQKGRSLEFPNESIYRKELPLLTELHQYATKNNLEAFISIETTRGCPFACVYCEWGGGTNSRIVQKNIAVVKDDILAMREAGYRSAYLTDSNFGIFEKRDIEIFRFAFEHDFALTDISTVKSKNLERRKRIVDAWFDIVGKGPEKKFIETTDKGKNLTGFKAEFISTLPTVSIQSISDEAMKIAQREDLSFVDKIKLSEHIHSRCHEEGYPVPALELISVMPGSTVDDFYKEMEIIWNFKAWTSFRHDYMFLPDTSLSSKKYVEDHKIELVEVYTDLVDEQGVENKNSLYFKKRNYFYTIASSFSISREQVKETYFMNLAGNYLLRELYPIFENYLSPSTFGKKCYRIIKQLAGFKPYKLEIDDLFDPTTPARNIKRLLGVFRIESVENLLIENKNILLNQLFIEVNNENVRRAAPIEETRDLHLQG